MDKTDVDRARIRMWRYPGGIIDLACNAAMQSLLLMPAFLFNNPAGNIPTHACKPTVVPVSQNGTSQKCRLAACPDDGTRTSVIWYERKCECEDTRKTGQSRETSEST